MIILKFQDDRPENSPKTAIFLDTKSAVERARRLKMQRNLFVVMRICSPVVLSDLDAGLEPWCRRRYFLTTCCCLLAAACLLLLLAACENVLPTLDPKKGCKTSTW